SHANHSVRSQILQRFLAQVRDIPGDFLRPELGITRADFKFIDVNRGENVVLYNPLADEDGVLEVVTIPWHERAKHVPPQSEFTFRSAGTVGNDLPLLDGIPLIHEDFLVDAGGRV